jgi:hypothetical protein
MSHEKSFDAVLKNQARFNERVGVAHADDAARLRRLIALALGARVTH